VGALRVSGLRSFSQTTIFTLVQSPLHIPGEEKEGGVELVGGVEGSWSW
jgi:hypothetical protein